MDELGGFEPTDTTGFIQIESIRLKKCVFTIVPLLRNVTHSVHLSIPFHLVVIFPSYYGTNCANFPQVGPGECSQGPGGRRTPRCIRITRVKLGS